MGTEPSLPSVYADSDPTLRLLPFIVSHTKDAQDQLIFGPRTVANSHDAFIRKLYTDLNDMGPFSYFRIFRFRGRLCIASVFGTSLQDCAGRENLTLAFGVVLNGGTSQRQRLHAAHFIETMYDTLNSLLGTHLPRSGADVIVRVLESRDERDLVREKLLLLTRILLFAARLPPSGSAFGTLWQFVRGLVRIFQRVPSRILYNPTMPVEQTLRVLMSTVAHVNLTGELADTSLLAVNGISIVPAPNSLIGAQSVRVRRVVGNSVILVFKTKENRH